MRRFSLFFLLCFLMPALQPEQFTLSAQKTEIKPEIYEVSFNPVGIAHSDSFLALNQPSPQEEAQNSAEPDNKLRVWLSFGFGLAVPQDLGMHLGLTFRSNQHLFGVRVAGSGQLSGNRYTDFALLYGRSSRLADNLDLYLSAGAALVTGQLSGMSGSSTTLFGATPGLPLQAQLSWNAPHSAGIGLTAFGNINAEQSFAGLTFTINIGNMR